MTDNNGNSNRLFTVKSYHLVIFFVLISAIYFFRISLMPVAGGDEEDNLSVSYHYEKYGTRQELVMISDKYNQRECRKVPFPWVSFPRDLFHKIVGTSSLLSRTFSAAIILICLLMMWFVWVRYAGFGNNEVMLMLLMAALSPALYFTARTVRFEHEYLIIGLVSIFLPLLLKPGQSAFLKIAILSVSGALSAWLLASHPGAMVFGFVQFSLFVRYSAYWREKDGFPGWKRLFFWLAGGTIVVAVCVFIVYSDIANWQVYLADTNSRFLVVRERYIEQWAPLWRFPAGPSPKWLVATLYAFQLSATSPYISFPGKLLVVMAFFIQSAVVFFYAIPLVFRPCPDTKGMVLRVCAFLSAGFIFFHFFYGFKFAPNFSFYSYMGLLIPVTFTWIAIESARRFSPGRFFVPGVFVLLFGMSGVLFTLMKIPSLSHFSKPFALAVIAVCGLAGVAALIIPSTRKMFFSREALAGWSTQLPMLVVVLTVVLNLQFIAYYNLETQRTISGGNLLSLDQRFAALDELSKRLGWKSDSDTPFYIDNVTWHPAGANWKSTFEALLSNPGPEIDDSAYFIFDAFLLDHIFDYPGWAEVQLTPEERMVRLHTLASGRTLRGVLFEAENEYMFYAPEKAETDDGVQVGVLAGNGSTAFYRTGEEVAVSGDAGKAITYDSLQPGRYILVLQGGALMDSRVSVVSSSNSVENNFEWHLGPIYHEVAKTILIDVANDGTAISVEVENDTSERVDASLVKLVEASQE